MSVGSRHRTVRLLLLAGLAALTGCSSYSTVVLSQSGDGNYRAGAPFDPRPGAGEVAYLAGREILSVNYYGRLDHLLVQDARRMVDLAFRSESELLVLQRDRVSIYFAGRLITGWEFPVSDDARIEADGPEVWIATNRNGRGRLLRLDSERNEFRVIAELTQPVTDVAAGRHGCYFAFADSVYRLALNAEQSEAEMVFVMALPPGSTITGVAADFDNQVIYASTKEATYAYAGGKVVPFYALGGRLRCDGGDLYIASKASGSLVKIGRAYKRAWGLAD